MVSTTSCSIKPQLTKRSVLTITTSAVVPYLTTHITADTTQCTYRDNVSSDFYSQQRRRLQQLLQQHLLPESKEQETLDSAGPTWTAVQCEAGSDWPVGFGKTGGSGAGITISTVW